MGGGSHGPWFLGGSCKAAVVLGVCSLVLPGMREADGCPHPLWLQGRAVAVQRPPGAYKSRKIKFFPAKSVGRVNWRGARGWPRCSFSEEVCGAVPPREGKLRHGEGDPPAERCPRASVSPPGCSWPCRAMGHQALRSWGAGFGEGRRPQWQLLPWARPTRGPGGEQEGGWGNMGHPGGIGGHLGLYGVVHGATSRHMGQARGVGASRAARGTLRVPGATRGAHGTTWGRGGHGSSWST